MAAVPSISKYSPEIVARINELPFRMAPVQLEGKLIYLRPLEADRDAAILFERMHGQAFDIGSRHQPEYDSDELVWKWMPYGPFPDLAAFHGHLQAWERSPTNLTMTVFERSSDSPVGLATFMANQPEHLRVELGGICYSPLVQGRGYNTEATLLMARHCFALGYLRLEWKTDSRNQRSRRAAARMGFKFEAIQEAHMVIKGGRRDTAWFRILRDEWPQVEQDLIKLVPA